MHLLLNKWKEKNASNQLQKGIGLLGNWLSIMYDLDNQKDFAC